MSDFNFVLLYVDDPSASAAFYAGLLGKPVVEESAVFAMLPLNDALMLGLWQHRDVEPVATAPGGGEIAFLMADAEAVDQMHADWKKRGLPIAQAPTTMDFGRTFVALDPDGHRLRVYARPTTGHAR